MTEFFPLLDSISFLLFSIENLEKKKLSLT